MENPFAPLFNADMHQNTLPLQLHSLAGTPLSDAGSVYGTPGADLYDHGSKRCEVGSKTSPDMCNRIGINVESDEQRKMKVRYDEDEGVNANVIVDMDIGIYSSEKVCDSNTPKSATGVYTTTTAAVTMPTTTTITTCAVMATYLASNSVTQTSMTATTTTTVSSLETYSDSKHKEPEEKNDECITKKCNTTESPIKSEKTLIERMHEEVMGIKTVVADIQAKNKEWKEKLKNLQSEINEVKDSVNMAHNMINDETKERTKMQKEFRIEMTDWTKEITNNVQRIKSHSGELKSCKETISKLQDKVERLGSEQERLKSPVKKLEANLKNLPTENAFEVNKTIVVQKVWYEEHEDLGKVASAIINKALDLPDIKIVRVERKSGKNTGKGLLKIELEDSECVKIVLSRKKQLQHAPVKELKEVFLRESKGDERLKMERNMDLVLNNLGVREEYVRLQSGYLVRHDEHTEVSRQRSLH